MKPSDPPGKVTNARRCAAVQETCLPRSAEPEIDAARPAQERRMEEATGETEEVFGEEAGEWFIGAVTLGETEDCGLYKRHGSC